MKTLSKSLLLLSLNLVAIYESNGQIANYIFAMTQDSANYFNFSRTEIATGNMTVYPTIGPLTLLAYCSSCINYQANLYYLSTPTHLITFDALTGQTVSNVVLPIQPTSKFQK